MSGPCSTTLHSPGLAPPLDPARAVSLPVANNASTATTADVANPDVCPVAVKFPPFWADSPRMWFAQAEDQFSLAHITQDWTRYDSFVAHLDPRYVTELRDILASPPADDRYPHLKTELNRRLSLPEAQKVRTLLQFHDIGDREPSRFLRHMRAMADNTRVDDSVR